MRFSRFNIETYGEEYQRRMAEAQRLREERLAREPEPAYVVPTALPLRQKIALLWMRTRSELAREVLDAVEAIPDTPKPTAVDFAELVRAAWATKETPARHRLTQSGIEAADMVARDLAKQMGLHISIQLGESRYRVSMSCTCGDCWSFSKNEGHIWAQKAKAWTRHLDRVAKGYTGPKPLAEILPDLFKTSEAG